MSADGVAIVGMAGRFPGARDVGAFWDNIKGGVESITHFPVEELEISAPGTEMEAGHAHFVCAKGILDDVDLFDARFFGYLPREAELMDPQQRIFLELCWECIERAGHVPDATTEPVGVFAGMYNASYYQRNVLAHPDLVDKLGAFQVMLGNEKDYIATRVAHKLNLTGPAVSVKTEIGQPAAGSSCRSKKVRVCWNTSHQTGAVIEGSRDVSIWTSTVAPRRRRSASAARRSGSRAKRSARLIPAECTRSPNRRKP